jgi:membrane-associated HD superfamily phosphohydrolase
MLPGDVSRHEQLVPAMSTLIIIGHVKDGSDLARQHHVPKVLIDFIEQHHGTTLVEYFFHAATRQAETQPDHRFDVQESAFRYPGPKPQSKETAVLMIADAVEGASRTLDDPTPKRLETLVHDIAMKRLLDGQFDECSLTLRELAIVEDSLTKSLISIHHGRIRYPEQRSA